MILITNEPKLVQISQSKKVWSVFDMTEDFNYLLQITP